MLAHELVIFVFVLNKEKMYTSATQQKSNSSNKVGLKKILFTFYLSWTFFYFFILNKLFFYILFIQSGNWQLFRYFCKLTFSELDDGWQMSDDRKK